MADPYLSEIQIFAFDFAPKFWAECNGQLLNISQNQALFSLLGTTYGGNGQTTFALPDLRGRTGLTLGQGPGLSNYNLGQNGGSDTHTLTTGEMPQHNHTMLASPNTADRATANNNLLAGSGSSALFHTTQDGTTMAPNMIANAGGSQAHTNLQPHLALNFCIALAGIFPSRN